MKFLRLIFVICAINVGCNAQDNINNNSISILKNFYTAHIDFWSNSTSVKKRLDSLEVNYCTNELRTKAKKYFQDGHDLFTNDWDISKESLPTLKVIKDPAKENNYIVSYTVNSYPVSPDKPVKKEVVLHITLIKENGHYKINSIR